MGFDGEILGERIEGRDKKDGGPTGSRTVGLGQEAPKGKPLEDSGVPTPSVDTEQWGGGGAEEDQ